MVTDALTFQGYRVVRARGINPHIRYAFISGWATMNRRVREWRRLGPRDR